MEVIKIENKLCSGHYKPEEKKTCGECGVEIGDYAVYGGITRCVGCWNEFNLTQSDDSCSDGVYAVHVSQKNQELEHQKLA